MTIQDAIRSGKPFRLPSWFHLGKKYYADVAQNQRPPTIEGKEDEITLHVFELLADDWEVKP